jgi:hypothetical protein
MFCDHNPGLESRNYIDGLTFTRSDPCVWTVYPPGAAGDLLISIINQHYLRTGCEYYGIDDRGRTMIYTTDYEMIDLALKKNQSVNFDDQWFYDFSDQLGQRNLTYSMLDQVIFGCHLCQAHDIHHILGNFSQARIINIHAQDKRGQDIIRNMAKFKIKLLPPSDISDVGRDETFQPNIVQHDRVLNVPFGLLFSRDSYDKCYAAIRKFLNLSGPLICFEYVEFWLSKQHDLIRNQLQTYSQGL